MIIVDIVCLLHCYSEQQRNFIAALQGYRMILIFLYQAQDLKTAV